MQKSTWMSVGQAHRLGKFVVEALLAVRSYFSSGVVQKKISDGDWVSNFKQEFIQLVKRLIPTNPFSRERVDRAADYPKGWTLPPLDDQKARLTEIFPRIDLSHVDALVDDIKIPKSKHRFVDGIAIIPKFTHLLKTVANRSDFNSDYAMIGSELVKRISLSQSFYNKAGPIDDRHIRVDNEAMEIVSRLEGSTLGDVLVLPINFGSFYAGWSPRAAKWEALSNGQLPLISVQIFCLLLTMPDRLASGSLGVDLSADGWDPDGTQIWSSCTTYLTMEKDEIELSMGSSGEPTGGYGTPIAFL